MRPPEEQSRPDRAGRRKSTGVLGSMTRALSSGSGMRARRTLIAGGLGATTMAVERRMADGRRGSVGGRADGRAVECRGRRSEAEVTVWRDRRRLSGGSVSKGGNSFTRERGPIITPLVTKSQHIAESPQWEA